MRESRRLAWYMYTAAYQGNINRFCGNFHADTARCYRRNWFLNTWQSFVRITVTTRDKSKPYAEMKIYRILLAYGSLGIFGIHYGKSGLR